MSDSAGRMAVACKRMPAGPLQRRVEDMLDALRRAADRASGKEDWGRAYGNDERLEEDLDEELDKLVSELEDTVAHIGRKPSRRPMPTAVVPASTALVPVSSALVAAPAACKLGCGRPCKRPADGRIFDTCCRGCAVSKGGGVHDDDCTGTTALATIETGLVPGGTGARGDGRKNSSGAGDARGGCGAGSAEHGFSIPEALQILGLDDVWPTDLTWKEIRRRYMKEALKCHPDKGGPEEKAWRTDRFQRLAAAYAALEAPVATLERIREGGGFADAGDWEQPRPAPAPAPAPPGLAALTGGQLQLGGVSGAGAPAKAGALLALPSSVVMAGIMDALPASPGASYAPLALPAPAARNSAPAVSTRSDPPPPANSAVVPPSSSGLGTVCSPPLVVALEPVEPALSPKAADALSPKASDAGSDPVVASPAPKTASADGSAPAPAPAPKATSDAGLAPGGVAVDVGVTDRKDKPLASKGCCVCQ